MKNHPFHSDSAQTAIEYMLLLGVVAAIVLIGMRTLLPRAGAASNVYFNSVAVGIMGKPNLCGNGNPDPFETLNNCCIDKGGCAN